MFVSGSLKRLRKPTRATAEFCFNKPLFRPSASGPWRGSQRSQGTSRSFATASHAYDGIPLSFLFRTARPRRPHGSNTYRTSNPGDSSTRRPWEKTQQRSRPRLETKQPSSPLLGDLEICDSYCAIKIDASISILDTVRAIYLIIIAEEELTNPRRQKRGAIGCG